MTKRKNSLRLPSLSEDELKRASGGLAVATETMPKAMVGQSVTDYCVRVARYCYAYTHGGYGE